MLFSLVAIVTCTALCVLRRIDYFWWNKPIIKKSQLKKTIESLPEQFTIDQIIDQLILLDKIEKAEKASENGQVIKEEDLDQELEKWF